MKKEFLVTPDLTRGNFFVTLFGRELILIENYKSIISYTDKQIKMQGKDCKISMEGMGLRIERFGCMDCKILGTINKLEFISEEAVTK